MKSKFLGVERVLDMQGWQLVQDSISDATGLAIVTVDYRGVPLTKHSNCQAFCEKIRENPKMFEMCQRCDSRGGLEAVRDGKPYTYRCHFDLVDVAIPIIIDDKYMGAIMAGQAVLHGEAHHHLERMVEVSNDPVAHELLEKYIEEYKKVPVFSGEHITKVANMISSVVSYLISEMLKNGAMLETYRKIREENPTPSAKEHGQMIGMSQIAGIQEEMQKMKLNHYITEMEDSTLVCKNEILKPAFEYIWSHKNEKITLEKMAEVCHISASYFSRLFSKEVGRNFTSYLSKVKVDWAKRLLEQADMTVTEIASELGFSESGYFIKIYKKHEGITPAQYQKYCGSRES